MNSLIPSFLSKATALLRAHFRTEVHITSTVQLTNKERRNRLVRLYLEGKDIPQSCIVKQSFREAAESEQDRAGRFARDWAGLEFLSQIASDSSLAPQFYGGSKDHRFIVLEDLGNPHVSLVDVLTQNNRTNALAALKRFMTCLGQFHAVGYGKTALYFEILKGLNPHLEKEVLKKKQEHLTAKLESLLEALDISFPTECQSEVHAILRNVLEPGPFTTFTHGDNCPDNVFDNLTQNKLRLIDFEWGGVGNALLDATYLRMSMPTCWCAKAFPEEVIEPLEHIYREELARTVPAAQDEQAYEAAYRQACAFWMLHTLSEAPKYLEKDQLGCSADIPPNALWDPKKNAGRPRVLSRLQAFIDLPKADTLFPQLSNTGNFVLENLKLRWPEAKPLDLFPAFREN